MELKNIKDKEIDLTVWRYMSVSKFISLVTYQALWFSKLKILQDEFEGKMPVKTQKAIHAENQKFKKQFNTPEYHRQIDNWNIENENSGRELLVVNCWFLDENESERMWTEYGNSKESVAIKTTVRSLINSVLVPHDKNISQIGKVTYVDHNNHEMNKYEANQAHERAFLKDAELFSHEKELRIVTMNFKTTNCANLDGKPYTQNEVAGKNMNNYENPGLYIGVLLDKLLSEIVVCPNADDWVFRLIRRINEMSGINAKVSRSEL